MDLHLHLRQWQALRSQASEILYGGAAGGGKSHLMRVVAIYCASIPNLQIYLFRRTLPDLLKNHLTGPTGFPALLAEMVNRKICSINYSRNRIEFSNGAKIHLCYCDKESDVYKYQGAEIHVLLIDELTHFTESMYRFLRGRVRLGGLKIPDKYQLMFPRILCASNPGSIGHNWVKMTFVDWAPPMEIRQAPKTEGGMMRQYVPARLDDNPTLTKNDPDYEFRLEGLGNPELVRAMRMGDWDIVAGGMLDDLWRRDTHVIEPFEIPSSWQVDRSFDWGSSKPFSVLWWAESDGTHAPNGRHYPPGTIFLINEWYGWNGRANQGLKMLAVEIAKGIVEREAAYPFRVDPGAADSSIFDAENGVCIADDMAAAGVYWLPADKSPGSRVTGWERLRKMLKASIQRPMEDAGLFIFNNCSQWIRTVPVLPRSERKPDDVDTEAEDHAGDATRYRIMKPNLQWKTA
jgi:terminase large subunit-like protein